MQVSAFRENLQNAMKQTGQVKPISFVWWIAQIRVVVLVALWHLYTTRTSVPRDNQWKLVTTCYLKSFKICTRVPYAFHGRSGIYSLLNMHTRQRDSNYIYIWAHAKSWSLSTRPSIVSYWNFGIYSMSPMAQCPQCQYLSTKDSIPFVDHVVPSS